MADTISLDGKYSDKSSALDRLLNLGLKTKNSDTLKNVSAENIELVGQLMEMSKKLKKANRHKDADKLLDIAEKVLENNNEVLATVGRLMSSGD